MFIFLQESMPIGTGRVLLRQMTNGSFQRIIGRFRMAKLINLYLRDCVASRRKLNLDWK